MKITPELTGLAGTKPGNTEKARGSTEPQAGSPAAPVLDTIHLSARSTQLKELQSASGVGESFDATKVDAIRQAIRDGQFKVDAEVVADRMIESSLAKLKPL